ncbi:hypothetical protein [Streptomyces xanthii]|uniref:Uncharacterized protein n=1 Tax=Streptomyces xanthii TaxID=2768069 RepID=A0A7H1BL43_9ACTN|nr:hypothetical protein [Streptomyces xanthii]QNS09448.1 hypothetical protein IAG42_37445 [Streptomyces xanthii]
MSERSYSCETAVAVAEAVRPWLDKDTDEPPPAAAIVAALRAAEAEHGGYQRDLWGRAAGNAACATAAVDESRAGWLWATSLDYVVRAVEAAPPAAVPPSGESANAAHSPLPRASAPASHDTPQVETGNPFPSSLTASSLEP